MYKMECNNCRNFFDCPPYVKLSDNYCDEIIDIDVLDGIEDKWTEMSYRKYIDGGLDYNFDFYSNGNWHWDYRGG